MELSLAKFRNDMATPVNRVAFGGERVTLTRHGKSVAVIVSVEDLQTLEAIEDAADVKAALKARKEKGAIPWEQVKAELGLVGSAQPVKPGEGKKLRRAKA